MKMPVYTPAKDHSDVKCIVNQIFYKWIRGYLKYTQYVYAAHQGC